YRVEADDHHEVVGIVRRAVMPRPARRPHQGQRVEEKHHGAEDDERDAEKPIADGHCTLQNIMVGAFSKAERVDLMLYLCRELTRHRCVWVLSRRWVWSRCGSRLGLILAEIASTAAEFEIVPPWMQSRRGCGLVAGLVTGR